MCGSFGSRVVPWVVVWYLGWLCGSLGSNEEFMLVQAHLYQLMRSDSYCRYLRSDQYKDYLAGSKKKVRTCRQVVTSLFIRDPDVKLEHSNTMQHVETYCQHAVRNVIMKRNGNMRYVT